MICSILSSTCLAPGWYPDWCSSPLCRWHHTRRSLRQTLHTTSPLYNTLPGIIPLRRLQYPISFSATSLSTLVSKVSSIRVRFSQYSMISIMVAKSTPATVMLLASKSASLSSFSVSPLEWEWEINYVDKHRSPHTMLRLQNVMELSADSRSATVLPLCRTESPGSSPRSPHVSCSRLQQRSRRGERGVPAITTEWDLVHCELILIRATQSTP